MPTHASQSNPTQTPAAPLHLKPLEPEYFGPDEARHLLWRAGFGGTPDQIQLLAEWGLERSVEYLVQYEQAPAAAFPEFDSAIITPLTDEQRRAYRVALQNGDENAVERARMARQAQQRSDRQQFREVVTAWLERMIESPRPLQEKMTLFWHGHFATNYRQVQDSYHMALQNELLRTHATGSFADLLHSIIQDPAMLRYLNNNASTKRRPNENLARELLELFSLGEGNYTERDIKEGARALTGHTFEDDQFTIDQRNHDTGFKRILGRTNVVNGQDFVNAILAQHACSRFIAAKLYSFFVAHAPTNRADQSPDQRNIIQALATSLRTNQYQLAPTLKELFSSQHFYHHTNRRQQIKSPAVLTVGLIRSLQTPVRSIPDLLRALDAMGQSLMAPPSVEGWPGDRTWISSSTLFTRQNTAAYLLTGQGGSRFTANSDTYDPAQLLAPLRNASRSPTPAQATDYLLNALLGTSAVPERSSLITFIEERGGRITDPTAIGVLLLITAMPEYQLC